MTRLWGCALILWLPCVAAAQEAEAGAEADAGAGAEDATMADARARLARGQALYEAEDYEGALAEFTRLYERLEGHEARPLALYNMARCHERMFAYDEAIGLYERYLDEAGPDGRYLEAVRAKLESLNDLLGTVRITVRFEGPPVAWVLREGEREYGAPERIRLPAGTHRLEVSAEGYELASASVTFAAGDVREVELTLRERFEGLSPDAFVVSVAGGALFAAAAVALGVAALVDERDLASCPDRPGCLVDTLPTREARADRIVALAAATDVAWGLAGAAAVTAVVLAFFTRFDEPEDERVRLRGLGLEVSWR